MSSDLNDPTGVNHYVAPATTTTLVVDAVRVDEKPSNLWSDAWRDLRRGTTLSPRAPGGLRPNAPKSGIVRPDRRGPVARRILRP